MFYFHSIFEKLDFHLYFKWKLGTSKSSFYRNQNLKISRKISGDRILVRLQCRHREPSPYQKDNMATFPFAQEAPTENPRSLEMNICPLVICRCQTTVLFLKDRRNISHVGTSIKIPCGER